MAHHDNLATFQNILNGNFREKSFSEPTKIKINKKMSHEQIFHLQLIAGALEQNSPQKCAI
jgi:hypothetical protein